MKFRIAKKSDKKVLASIHMECGKIQPDGFMYQLGLPFLTTYYSILISETKSIIVLAEDENGVVQGFCSGTLAADEHLEELRRNKIKLAFSLIPALLKSPKLLKNLIARDKYINASAKSVKFGVSHGGRCEYWAWRPENKNLIMSMRLFQVWRNILFELGSESIKGEVDMLNKYILKIHKISGAKIIKELNLPDGRNRVIIEYTKKTK